MSTAFSNNNNENARYLKISIVEPILISCINDVSFSDIHLELVELAFETILKEYLFYLVDGSFIRYNGEKKSILSAISD